MADVKWIKIVTDVFSNRKIKQIEMMPEADSVIVIWFKLICLAGNVNENGLLIITKDIPYTDEMLAAEFRRPLNTVRLALEMFIRFGMVEIIDDVMMVSNWEKYQNVESLERIREQTKKRVGRYREKQKLLVAPNGNVTGNVTVTSCNETDIELELDKESIYTGKKKGVRFTPPTIIEVKEYCAERNNGIDAEYFIDYYTARDWMLKNVKMKNWQSAIRTWEKNKQYDSKPQQKTESIEEIQRRIGYKP